MDIFCHMNAFDGLRKRFWRDLWANLTSVWPTNIKRIISFIPVLWNDWDFDSRPGLYCLIKKKLERLEPCLRYGHLMNGPKYADQIKIILAALDRLIADNYEEEELKAVEEKWGQLVDWFEHCDDGSGFMEWKMERPGAQTAEQKEQEKADSIAAYKRADKRKNDDKKLVFRGIEKLHGAWWD